jgi:hypothetical protein
MNDIGVARDAADRQVVGTKCIADFLGLVLGDLAGRQVDILEVQVELYGVEAVAANFLRRLFEPVGEVPRKNPGLHHGVKSSL